jgi:hypothetical protein
MSRLHNTLVSAAATAAILVSPSSNGEQAPQLPSAHTEQVSTAKLQAGKAAACTALRELRYTLSLGEGEAVFIFGDTENIYGAVLPPDDLRQQADQLKANLVDQGVIRDNPFSADGLGAVETNRLSADATADVIDKFSQYQDILQASAEVDQSGAEALIAQVRAATDAALTHCS